MKFELHQTIEILRRTPVALNSLLRGLADPWILNNEGPDTWSPHEVLGHLIHGEETDWIPRLELILEKGVSETFAPFDRVGFVEACKGKTLDELLDTFEVLRNSNIRILEQKKLQPHQLAWQGLHPEFGIVTLTQLLAAWVVHDLGHLRQIARVMAKQYAGEVGPWKAYLSILGE